MTLRYWQTIVDLTHVPTSRSCPSALNESKRDLFSVKYKALNCMIKTLKFEYPAISMNLRLPNYTALPSNCSAWHHRTYRSYLLAHSWRMQRIENSRRTILEDYYSWQSRYRQGHIPPERWWGCWSQHPIVSTCLIPRQWISNQRQQCDN